MDHYDEFASFYSGAHQELVHAVVLSVGSAELGREAVDEAFVRAAERWSHVRKMSNRRGWIYRVALNRVTDHRRWKRRRPNVDVARLVLVAPEEPSLVELSQRLSVLALDLKAVVVMRYVLDLSVQQTADSLGLSSRAVRAKTAGALRTLREAAIDPETERMTT